MPVENLFKQVMICVISDTKYSSSLSFSPWPSRKPSSSMNVSAKGPNFAMKSSLRIWERGLALSLTWMSLRAGVRYYVKPKVVLELRMKAKKFTAYLYPCPC